MTGNIVGLFKGIEQHRNVLYLALWLQIEGTEQKTVYRITITRSNRGNIYSWNGPEISTIGAKIDGFVTGKPQTIIIGKMDVNSNMITEIATRVNRAIVLQPHDFVIALLKELESCDIYKNSISKLWSFRVQEMWDTQDIIIPTRDEIERRNSSYGITLTKKYNSLHQIVGNCPTTDGMIEVREQREYYDPRTLPGIDPVNDGSFRRKSRTPSPLQSPTQASRIHPGGLTRATTMPVSARRPPRIQTRFGHSVPPTTRCESMTDTLGHTCSPIGAPDPRMRPFEARKRSSSSPSKSRIDNMERRKSPLATRPPRSKTDRRRNGSSTDRKVQQVEAVKTVLKVLAATAMTVT